MAFDDEPGTPAIQRLRAWLASLPPHWFRYPLTQLKNANPELWKQAREVEKAMGMVPALKLMHDFGPLGVERRAKFEPYTVEARKALDLPPAQRSTYEGDDCMSFMKGLDVLECLGERLDEVRAERARRRSAGSKKRSPKRLCLSPWDRKTTNAKDVAWLATLRVWFPEKPWLD